MSRRYTQVYDGDCGLVHRINFKIEKKGGRTFLFFQAFRDTKATKLSRRQRRRKHGGRS